MTSINNQVIETKIRISLTKPMAVLSVSESVYELLGFKVDDFITGHVTLESQIHAHDQDIAEALFSSEINQSESNTINIRLRQANGRIRCMKGTYTKTFDATFNAVILDLLLQDSKSLFEHQGEQTLIANFKAMMENTDDYIYFKDRNHVFTGASETLVAITDPSEHWTDLIGQTDYDVFPEALADIYYRLEKQVYTGVNLAQEEQETLDNQGNKGWVDNRKNPIRNDEGEIVGLFGIARDVTKRKKAEADLIEAEAFANNIFNSVTNEIAVLDNNGVIVAVNASWEKFAIENGLEIAKPAPHNEVGTNYLQACRAGAEISSENGMNAYEGIRAVLDGHVNEFYLEYPCHSPNQKRWFSMMVSPLKPLFKGVVITHTNITERIQAETNLKISAIAFESQEGMVVTDASGTILRVNKAFTKITGYPAEEVIGKNPRILKSCAHDASFYVDLWQRIAITGTYEGEVQNRRKNGEVYTEHLTISAVKDDMGNITHYVGAFIDISLRKENEARISFLANYDQLTGLPNRELFYDRLSQAISQARRKSEGVALLFLDLDGFKPVNDTHGHEAGDVVLKVVATRLQACVRSMDTVARMGGDEFSIIISAIQNSSDAEAIAQKIIDNINEVIKLDATTTCVVGISIGIAIYPDNGTEIDMLMHAADRAMYDSKAAGKNTYTISTLQNQAAFNAPWINPDEVQLLGVQIIDEQHLKIVSMLNLMNDAIKQNAPNERLMQLLDEIISFTNYHFKTEEQLMHAYGYLAGIEHKNTHEHLLHEVKYLKSKFIKGGELVFLQKLKDWFIIHISNSDKPLADFILQQDAKKIFSSLPHQG